MSHEKKKRPHSLNGTTVKLKVGCGNLHLTLNYNDEYKLIEVMSQLGKSGSCFRSQTDALSRVISIALDHGASLNEIISVLEDIHCPTPSIDHGIKILSCPDAFAKAFKNFEEYIKDHKSKKDKGTSKGGTDNGNSGK